MTNPDATDPDATASDPTDPDAINPDGAATSAQWPTVIHALRAGEQVAVVLAEPPGGTRIVLTSEPEAERPDLIKVPYRRWTGDQPADTTAATVVGWASIDLAASADSLAEACIWLPELPVHTVGARGTVVALRVEDPDGRPVLSDVAFEARLKSLIGKLPEGSWTE